MLNISSNQLESVSQLRKHQFVQRTVNHLRSQHAEACKSKDGATLSGYVEAMIAFARKHGVVQQDNVLRLIDLQVTTGYSAELAPYPRHRLAQQGIDESGRVRHFGEALALTNHPVVISLDSDLRAVRGG